MKEPLIVVRSLLKAFMQTTLIPLNHFHFHVCSILSAPYYTIHYLPKHRSMLVDMSSFVAVLCVCFATLHDARRHAAACGHIAVVNTESCSDVMHIVSRLFHGVWGIADLRCDVRHACFAHCVMWCALSNEIIAVVVVVMMCANAGACTSVCVSSFRVYVCG